MMYELLTI